MKRISAIALMMIGLTAVAFARIEPSAPEIDPGSAVSALAFISGALLVIRGRRKA